MTKRPTSRQIESAMRFYAGGRIIKRSACTLAAVPPFCFAAAGRSLGEAVGIAAKALGLWHPADLIVLAWKLRAAAGGQP